MLADIVDVEHVACIERDQAVRQRHLGTQCDQAPRPTGTDKTPASGNQYLFVFKALEVVLSATFRANTS